MKKPRTTHLKNYSAEIKLFSFRLLLVSLLILILTAVLLSRLVYLQVEKHAHYTTLSQQNQLNLVPIPPTRGLIYDRNGILLAQNKPVFNLDIIPSKLTQDVDTTIKALQKIVTLSEEDLADFRKQLKRNHRHDAIPLKIKLTNEEVAQFSVNQFRFPGVLVKAQLIRYYPLGAATSDVIGYVGRISEEDEQHIDPVNYRATHYMGKLGIEAFYEQLLHGKVGYQQVETDASGRTVRILERTAPIPGDNIYLTIDASLQIAAEKALGEQRGAVVAIDPNNGDILALVSQPSYDPNLFVQGISHKAYEALKNAPGRPLYNRAIRGQYPMASTIKPFFLLQGLNTGTIDLHYRIQDPGYYTLKNRKRPYHDWRKNGHGVVDVYRSIVVSCDTFFYGLAHRMGIETMADILHQFGFGKTTGVDLTDELPGLVPTPQWKRRTRGTSWYPGDTVSAGIGQGYMLSTPLQLASAVGTIAMEGKRYQPHLMLKHETGAGNAAYFDPVHHDIDDIASEYWSTVIRAMKGVIMDPSGTAGGRFGRDAPYSAAGKTGTAQKISLEKFKGYGGKTMVPDHLKDDTLFIAFAPIEHPKIAVAVVLESNHQAPHIARRVIDHYLIKEKHPEINPIHHD
ncbi:MAG: penicillin-binding protein 2 [Gammaproteobacteria bacterium]